LPALDHFQPVVVHALQKAGWQITESPFTLRVDKRNLFIDIKAQSTTDAREIIVVEIKGFEGQSQIHNLEEAIGQYVIYRVLMEDLGYDFPLYLAVPQATYELVFLERVGRVIQQSLHVKIIVIDSDREEVARWIE
jgi:hypothetical protein